MVKAKLFLELLVRLLTDPSGFDGGSERLDGGFGRQVLHIIFLLPSRAPFADEPDLVAGHALHTVVEHAVLVAIGDANTVRRKETSQSTFSASAPSDPLPFLFGQQLFCGDRGLIRDMIFPRLSLLRDGEDQGDVGGIDVLASRQTHRPIKAALGSLEPHPESASTQPKRTPER
jgi:hypothetical protein